MFRKTLVAAGTLAAMGLSLGAAPATAAVDCTKDFDMLRGSDEQIDRSLADTANNTLTGWDTNNDGMISRTEYNKVCEGDPASYRSFQELPYFKKKQLQGS